MDKCLNTVLRLVKLFQGKWIQWEAIGEDEELVQRRRNVVLNHHRTALSMKVAHTKLSDGNFNIDSQSKPGKSYNVFRKKDSCECLLVCHYCKTCYHRWGCTCPSYTGNEMCKHIHFIIIQIERELEINAPIEGIDDLYTNSELELNVEIVSSQDAYYPESSFTFEGNKSFDVAQTAATVTTTTTTTVNISGSSSNIEESLIEEPHIPNYVESQSNTGNELSSSQSNKQFEISNNYSFNGFNLSNESPFEEANFDNEENLDIVRDSETPISNGEKNKAALKKKVELLKQSYSKLFDDEIHTEQSYQIVQKEYNKLKMLLALDNNRQLKEKQLNLPINLDHLKGKLNYSDDKQPRHKNTSSTGSLNSLKPKKNTKKTYRR